MSERLVTDAHLIEMGQQGGPLEQALAARLAALQTALEDCVRGAYEFGDQDGGFVAAYVMQTGPIHRALALLRSMGSPVSTRAMEVAPQQIHDLFDAPHEASFAAALLSPVDTTEGNDHV